MNGYEVLGVVAARGGSKGFPGKNKALFRGVPLVVRAVQALSSASDVDEVLISTDDSDIAELSTLAGAKFFGSRPEHLSADDATILSVLKYELYVWSQAMKREPWAVVLASPTTPLRQPKHVDSALRLLRNTKEADCVVSVSETPHQHSIDSQLIADDLGFVRSATPSSGKILRRQDKRKTYSRNGPCVLVLRAGYLKRCSHLYEGKVLGYQMDPIYGLDIDCPRDLIIAEAIHSTGLIKEE